MKHILNNLTEQEKQAILEQHKGGMKVMTESFSKLIKATLGDAKPLVSEQADDKYTHLADKGVDSPGIEKFMANPTDNTISNGLLYELRNDPYGKGKIVIIFNGEKFKEPGAFMFKIQTDFKAGKCYEITSYEYNNRFILNTQIKISANQVQCKKQGSPVKPPVKTGGDTTPIKTGGDTTPTPPKVGCKYKIVEPRRPKTYNGSVSEGSGPGERFDPAYIKTFQEFCSRKGFWKKDLADGTTVPCTDKDMDGKWGCCSQTCYNKTQKPKPKPKPIYDGEYIKGTDCPKYINCQPGPGKRNSMCTDGFADFCKSKGSQIVY